MVIHQLQVKHRPGKGRLSKTHVLPLSYTDQLREERGEGLRDLVLFVYTAWHEVIVSFECPNPSMYADKPLQPTT